MKKLSLLFVVLILFFLFSVSQVSAVDNFLTWTDFTTAQRNFVQPEPVSFIDDVMTFSGNSLETTISLINVNTGDSLLLVHEFTTSTFFTTYTIDSSSLEGGFYKIYSSVKDLTTGSSDEQSLFFTLQSSNNVTNHAPYFNNLTLYYSYELSLGNVDVLDLADFAVDPDNDSMTFSLNTSSTNESVVSCSLVSNSILNCDLNNVGSTTLGLVVSDGQASTQSNIFITVHHNATNHNPYFDNSMNLFYSYDLSETNSEDLVNLASYGRDPDNDSLVYALDTSMLNHDVADCYLISNNNLLRGISSSDLLGQNTIVHCDLNGVGTTNFVAIVSDGSGFGFANITLEVTNSTLNNQAPYFEDLPMVKFDYVPASNPTFLLDLANFAHDFENDSLTFTFNTVGTNPSVVSDCFLQDGSKLFCDVVGSGSTSIHVAVRDSYHSWVWDRVIVAVKSSISSNTAPYFVGLPLSYEYPLSQGSANLVDLSAFAHDDEFDTVSFILDTSMTDSSVVDCYLINNTFGTVPPTPYLAPSLLHCDLIGVGETSLKVGVSDGQFTTWELINISVYDDVVNHPPFFVGLQTYYSYNINLGTVPVVDLADYAVDPDNDSLSYLLDQSQTNLSVINCSLIENPIGPSNTVESLLICDLNNVGFTTLKVGVTDGQFTTWMTLGIKVYEDNVSTNHAPYFDLSMPNYFVRNLSITNSSDLVNLALFGRDVDGDTLSYSLMDSSSSVADCYLVDSPDVSTPNPFVNPVIVHCDLLSVGTLTFAAVVSDGNLSSTTSLLTLKVIDGGSNGNDTNNTNSTTGVFAIISSPGTSSFEGEESFVDGSHSYSPNSTIVNYDWLIKNIYGDLIYQNSGLISNFYFNFTEGTYYITLTVTDGLGNSSKATKIYKVYKSQSNPLVNNEGGLLILDYYIDGFDWERARIGGDFTITARVKNNEANDLDNVRLTFLLPDMGLRLKSQAVDMHSGEIKYFTIDATVPCDVVAETYYPYIIASNNDVRRVKIGYLEIYE